MSDDPLRPAAIRFTQRESPQLAVLDNARRDEFVSRIDDTPYRTLGPYEFPLPHIRIDCVELMPLKRAAVLLEVPPRYAVHGRYDGRVLSEKRDK
jgi:hypothetical protein